MYYDAEKRESVLPDKVGDTLTFVSGVTDPETIMVSASETVTGPFSPEDLIHAVIHAAARNMVAQHARALAKEDGDTSRSSLVRHINSLDEVIRRRNETIREMDKTIADLKAQLGERDAEKAQPQPAPISKPTRQDFVWAKFAVHPEGAWAARLEEDYLPWIATEGAGMDHALSDAVMAEDGWQIVTPAPTTARDLLAMLPGMCWEPEGDEIPEGTGCMIVWDNGEIAALPDGYPVAVTATFDRGSRLLLDPPAPKRPEWADADWVWAETETGARVIWEHLTGDPGDEWWAWGDRTLRLDEMAERRPVPVAPEEVKA